MALQAGQLFGNYRIVRLLGEGGFGEVYLAENPLLERHAAVKVLHTALAQDPELVRRFLNEARAVSAIRHPNIIEVFDGGVTPEGAPYILMEFLEGISLQKRLADKGRLSVAHALRIALQAGSALGAAHAAGIVHRDLKPENLFLVPDATAPGAERVKILDFGIAKIKRSGATGGTLRTQTGLIMGSPAYMSPEQCRDSADVDFRSDIYSFGVIMYEALAGRTPFVAASGTEMLVMHVTATPAPPRLTGVPAHVGAAVMRALAKERADRFDSVASFVSALLGQGVESGIASAGPSANGATTAAQAQPASGTKLLAVAPAITTFSRATGEVEASAGDEALPAVARSRRWPFVALGGLVGAGLTLFLLVRLSYRPTPEAATGHLGAAVPAVPASAAPALRPPLRQGAMPSQASFGVPDAGAAAAPSAAAQAGRRPASAAVASAAARAASAARPSPAATKHRRQVSRKEKAEDDLAVH
jgi:eukaryotic-like serine/threonine-protein kinase